MATRTAFSLTSDNSTTSYPDDSGWEVSPGDRPAQAEGRYSSIGVSESMITYPSTTSDEGFNLPKIRFAFLNAYGEVIRGAPSIYLKLPGNFNVTGFSDYGRTETIFGTGDALSAASIYSSIANPALQEKGAAAAAAGATAEALADLGNAGISGLEAFQYAAKKGLGNILGFIGSAGLSNIGQYEFMKRQAVNPMAQLLYKGPQFRRYQLPFTLKPKNKTESDNIRKIIGSFRVASSPSVPDTSGTQVAGISIGQGNSFTFGYPHLTQFTVVFINPEDNAVKKIFRSKVCVIESVSVDYGGQKMTFFEDGMPTEMNMTLQLTEVMPRTLGDSITDAKDPNIKLG